MKKIFLSVFVIVIFVVYALHQKSEESNVQVLPPTPTPKSQQVNSSEKVATPTLSVASTGMYKNGTYTGKSVDAFYGFIQVQIIIQNGNLADVQFLQYPNDRETSITINQQAMPLLKQEAIQAQSAQVDIVSGATDSSQAFQQSLQSALQKAQS